MKVRSKSNKYEDSDIYSYTVRIPYFFSSFYLYPGRNSSSLSNRDMVAYGNVTTSSLSLLCLSWQVTLQGSAKRFSYVSWQRERGMNRIWNTELVTTVFLFLKQSLRSRKLFFQYYSTNCRQGFVFSAQIEGFSDSNYKKKMCRSNAVTS